MAERKTEVAIVGGGLAGLRCAAVLAEAGVPFELFEAGDAPGGRVRTDLVEGFRLDRGFQVLLTAYPEAQRSLDFPALKLRRFYPGALIRMDRRFHLFADPWRRPWQAHRSLISPAGTFLDKLRVARLRRRLLAADPERLLERPAQKTGEYLRDQGFSHAIIEGFFGPFYGGVLLDRALGASSRMFEFTFRMFASGHAAVPEEGMSKIPLQMAGGLPSASLHLRSPVRAIEGKQIVLEGGERLSARAIVVATDARAASALLPDLEPLAWHGVTTLYYDAPASPLRGPLLILDAEGEGPVNNCTIMTEAAPTYAPPGRALVSATVLGLPPRGTDRLERDARAQLRAWFGPQVDTWKLLEIYEIADALPDQSPAALDPVHKPPRIGDGIFVCGDHRDLRSIEGALTSGRRAAEAVLAELRAQG